MPDHDVFVYFWNQVTQHNWKYVAVLLVIGLVALIRKIGSKVKWLAWTGTDFGGFVLATLTGTGGAVLHSIMAKQPLGLALSYGAAMSLMAVGGYVGSKHTVNAVRAKLKNGVSKKETPAS